MHWNLTPSQRMAVLSIATSIVTLSLKFGAWYVTGSVSLFSDAVESLVNVVAATVALVVLLIAERPPDASHPWGHEKAMYFSSGLEGALILVAAASIAWAAFGRLARPELPTELGIGIAISLVASTLNAVVAVVLMRFARRHDSIVLEADAHHLLTDVWTSVGVVAALAVLVFAPQWKILDPVVALLVAANIVRTGVSLMRRSAAGLMDSALPATELAAIEAAIAGALPASARFSSLRARKSGNLRHVEFKLLVPPETTVAASHALCDVLEQAITAVFDRTGAVIHVEPIGPSGGVAR